MEIKRDYHAKAVRFWKEMEQEETKRRANLSEEEKAAEETALQEGFQDILEKCKKWDRENFRIVSPEKMAGFTQMSEKALWLAKTAQMDISVKTEGVVGKIVFATDYFIINYCCPREVRMVIGELMERADDVCCHAKDSLFYMEFMFELYIMV